MTDSPALDDWRNARRYDWDEPAGRRVLEDIAQRLGGLDLLETAVWLFDAERCQCLWANRTGLGIWRAASVLELQRRDVASSQSEAVYALLNDYLARVDAGEQIAVWVNLEPRGKVRRSYQTHHVFTLADGRKALLIEAQPEPPAEEMLAFASSHVLTIGLYEMDGRLVSGNPAFMALCNGNPLQSLVGVLPADGSHTRLQALLEEQGKLAFELSLATERGPRLFRAELRAVRMRSRLLRAMLSLFDVTDERLVETQAALRRVQDRLDGILDSVEIVATVTYDFEAGRMEVDHRWWRMLGYEPDAFRLDFASFSALIHPEDLAGLANLPVLSGEGDQEAWSNEYRLRASDGSWRWVLDRGRLTDKTAGGVPRTASGVHLDINERHLAAEENERVSRQLQQAQKMDALGQLTGGIAHDFNNILASILGHAWLASQRPLVAQDQKLAESLATISTAGERGRDLVGKMLSFSRRRDVRQDTPINPLPVLSEAWNMLKAVLPSRIVFTLELPPTSPAVAIDPTELHQVLVNLVVNSRDALGAEGTIAVSLAEVRRDGEHCSACHASVAGSWVCIAIADTGAGIAAEQLTRIFDPFFTTKEIGAGTGIGLAVVEGILHRAGGHVLVSSVPGQGTRFELLLPPVAAVHSP